MATAALVFVALLVAAATAVSTMSAAALKPLRMTGPAVRRWGGVVLLFVGGWFLLLAALPSPIIGT
ncbi:MAG TPA: hypothetical protein VIL12_05645 [Acidimicrobiia bacterium]